MSRQFQSLLILFTFLVTVNVISFGMTGLIEMIGQFCNSIYSVGHDLGTYLRDEFHNPPPMVQ